MSAIVPYVNVIYLYYTVHQTIYSDRNSPFGMSTGKTKNQSNQYINKKKQIHYNTIVHNCKMQARMYFFTRRPNVKRLCIYYTYM